MAMIINCPSCSTRFSVDARALGMGGKTVRCFNCGHRWLQEPVWEAPRQPAYAQPAPQPMPYPMQQPMPQPGMYPMQQPMPQPGMYPMQPVMQQPMPQHMQPMPQPVPEPIPEPEPEPEPYFEPEPEPEPEPWVEPEELPSDEDLNTMFGEDAEPDGVDSFVGNPDADLEDMFDDEDTEPQVLTSLSGDSGGDENEFDDPDDFPEPEPIPGVFTSPSMRAREKKKKPILLIILVVFVVLLVGSIAGLFFAKSQIVAMVPALAPYYKMIGIQAEKPGAGLELQNVKTERTVDGGVDTLLVRGAVTNVSDMPRPVPAVKAWLFDADGNEVQAGFTVPEQHELEPGGKLAFTVKLPEPSDLARGVNVNFVNAEDVGHGEEAEHAEEMKEPEKTTN